MQQNLKSMGYFNNLSSRAFHATASWFSDPNSCARALPISHLFDRTDTISKTNVTGCWLHDAALHGNATEAYILTKYYKTPANIKTKSTRIINGEQVSYPKFELTPLMLLAKNSREDACTGNIFDFMNFLLEASGENIEFIYEQDHNNQTALDIFKNQLSKINKQAEPKRFKQLTQCVDKLHSIMKINKKSNASITYKDQCNPKEQENVYHKPTPRPLLSEMREVISNTSIKEPTHISENYYTTPTENNNVNPDTEASLPPTIFSITTPSSLPRQKRARRTNAQILFDENNYQGSNSENPFAREHITGQTFLMHATEEGNISGVIEAIGRSGERAQEMVNICDNTGKTALHYAAKIKDKNDSCELQNKLTIIAHLIDAGINSERRDNKGNTALNIAKTRTRINRLTEALS